MRIFKKTRLKIIKFCQMIDGRLGDITRSLKLIDEKMDKINTGEGTMVQVVDEMMKLREDFIEEVSQLKAAVVELKEEQEGTGIIMAQFIKLETNMIDQMSKFFALEAKSTEIALERKPEEPTEADKIF